MAWQCASLSWIISFYLLMMVQGLANRRTEATTANAESSRSHCVFTCFIKSESKVLPYSYSSETLNFIPHPWPSTNLLSTWLHLFITLESKVYFIGALLVFNNRLLSFSELTFSLWSSSYYPCLNLFLFPTERKL